MKAVEKKLMITMSSELLNTDSLSDPLGVLVPLRHDYEGPEWTKRTYAFPRVNTFGQHSTTLDLMETGNIPMSR